MPIGLGCSRARILVKNGTNQAYGTDWLTVLRLRIAARIYPQIMDVIYIVNIAFRSKLMKEVFQACNFKYPSSFATPAG